MFDSPDAKTFPIRSRRSRLLQIKKIVIPERPPPSGGLGIGNPVFFLLKITVSVNVTIILIPSGFPFSWE